MKILLIHNRYKEQGGEDVIFETDIQELSKRGHQVETLVFDNSHIEVETFLQKIHIGIASFYNQKAFKQTEKIIQTFRPNVVHVHNFFYVASPSIFYAAKCQNVPTVLTLHNYRLLCANALLMRENRICEDCVSKVFPLDGIIHKCFKNSAIQSAQITFITSLHKILGTWKKAIDHYIALTEFAKQKIVNSSLQIPAHKISVKPNAVPDYGFSPAKDRENFFLFVGRLSPEKGIDTLLDLAKNNRQIHIKIIGKGELSQKVRAFAEECGNVTYLGEQPKNKVIEYLKKCRALVFPSTWYEGLPTIILEAFSTGTPVIARNIDNLSSIVRNQQNGILLEFEKAKDLPFISENLYIRARKEFLTFYNFEECYRIQEKIYSSLQ
ncbi:MAG: glycosyltransferase family 4 protein [Cytophagales bacterium]|nr:glycosyltransferase family 4 protein [Cytophagales bacterium]MDW8384061.1 glycosyltransferase family 4 protein [Flammeovirgaceae bacterium]